MRLRRALQLTDTRRPRHCAPHNLPTHAYRRIRPLTEPRRGIAAPCDPAAAAVGSSPATYSELEWTRQPGAARPGRDGTGRNASARVPSPSTARHAAQHGPARTGTSASGVLLAGLAGGAADGAARWQETGCHLFSPLEPEVGADCRDQTRRRSVSPSQFGGAGARHPCRPPAEGHTYLMPTDAQTKPQTATQTGTQTATQTATQKGT